MRQSFIHLPGLLLLTCCLGCWSASDDEIVAYTALDREFSEQIYQQFTDNTGTDVAGVFDTESTKTVGLVSRIIKERDRPRCDLFWNNEILNTIRLQRQGLLEVYVPPTAAKFPAEFQSPDGTWHGFAARARVLLVNTDRVAIDDRPTSIHDLVDERWKGRVGIAKPLFGTTATHAACLFSAWGDERAKQFFQKAKSNCQVLSGNKQVALSVSQGSIDFGLTDTDDAIIEIEKGMPVAIIFPDQQEDEIGTLLIPNTLAIIKGCPHPERAKRLVDFLLTTEIEAKLANGLSAQFPLAKDATARSRAASENPLKRMKIDFEDAAEKWDAAALFLRDTFATAK